MRLNYAFNPTTGQHFISNMFSSPNAVQDFCDRELLLGFKPAAVNLPDHHWHMIKNALDINNNRIEIEHRIAETGANDVEAELEEAIKPVRAPVHRVKHVVITPAKRKAIKEEVTAKEQLLAQLKADQLELEDKVPDMPEGSDRTRYEDLLRRTISSQKGVQDRIDYLEVQLLETPQDVADYNARKAGEKEGMKEAVQEHLESHDNESGNAEMMSATVGTDLKDAELPEQKPAPSASDAMTGNAQEEELHTPSTPSEELVDAADLVATLDVVPAGEAAIGKTIRERKLEKARVALQEIQVAEM